MRPLPLGLFATLVAALPFGYEAHGSDWSSGTCVSRTAQSPINFNDIYGPSMGQFEVMYGEPLSLFEIVNDGVSLVASVSGEGRGVTVDGGAYDLESIAIHAPAEHTFGGRRPDLEIQLRHTQAGSPTAVYVSVVFDAPATAFAQIRSSKRRLRANYKKQPNPIDTGYEIETTVNGLPTQAFYDMETRAEVSDIDRLEAASLFVKANTTTNVTVIPYEPPSSFDVGYAPGIGGFLSSELPLPEAASMVNASWDLTQLVQANHEFYRYQGSETTPPCTENVQWIVSRTPMLASARQISQLRKAMKPVGPDGNWRSVMPFNQRPLEVLKSVARVSPLVVPDKIVDDREFIAKTAGEDAVTIATAAQNYARDLDQTLRTATIAHLKGYLAPPPAPYSPPAPSPSPEGHQPSERWLDKRERQRTTASAAANAVANAVNELGLEAADGLHIANSLTADGMDQAELATELLPPPPPPKTLTELGGYIPEPGIPGRFDALARREATLSR